MDCGSPLPLSEGDGGAWRGAGRRDWRRESSSRPRRPLRGSPKAAEGCLSPKIRRRGIRVVIGGDYGFSITPMGQNARDIGHFVKYFGYAPAEALRCADPPALHC